MRGFGACARGGLTALLLVMSGPGPAKADIIFSNFGPADTYNTEDGPVLGQLGVNRAERAAAFTVTGDSFSLDRIELAASLNLGPNRLVVTLVTSQAGLPGDTVLETWDIVNGMGPLGTTNPPLVLDATSHPILRQGEQYWLIAATPPGHDEAVIWNYNSVNGRGPTAARTNLVPWSPDDLPFQETFRVSGTPLVGSVAVPEPSTLALLAAGALALAAAGWRRRHTSPKR
jgi:hypothetical protein